MKANLAALLETAAKNFDDVSVMKSTELLKGDGQRRICLGLAQFTRATKPSLRDAFKQMLAETAAKNFDDAAIMTDAQVASGECLRRIGLGLAQLSRAMTAL